MVSTRPPTSKSSRPFNKPLVTVPKAPITIGIIVTFIFLIFFKVEVLIYLFTYFQFSSVVSRDSKVDNFAIDIIISVIIIRCISSSGGNSSSSTSYIKSKNIRRCPRGVMVKAMACGIVVCKFVLQSRYYVHFRANTLRKGMNPLIFPDMG